MIGRNGVLIEKERGKCSYESAGTKSNAKKKKSEKETVVNRSGELVNKKDEHGEKRCYGKQRRGVNTNGPSVQVKTCLNPQSRTLASSAMISMLLSPIIYSRSWFYCWGSGRRNDIHAW